MIEKDIIGGAAHLWDCIPSKAMIATGGTLARMGKASGMGLQKISADLDLEVLSSRIQSIEDRLEHSTTELLTSQGVQPDQGHRPPRRPPPGRGRQRRGPARDRGRRRAAGHRQPAPDPRLGRGRRRARAHHPRRLPAPGDARAPGGDRLRCHRCGVRPHVPLVRLRGHPDRQPPAGPPLEGPRGRRRARGRLHRPRRAPVQGGPGRSASRRRTVRSPCVCDDGRRARGSHALLAIGSIPNSEGLGLDDAGVEQRNGYVRGRPELRVVGARHLRRRRPVREAAAVVGRLDAGPQDRRARHGPTTAARSTATSTTTRPPRPSSPSPRSPTWAWPRPTPSPRAARSG